jgi:peptidoglycan/LPS O-acetylase OafA/YrhL
MGIQMKSIQAVGSGEKTAMPKIHALTSARFFAALYVVFFHTQWGVTPGGFLAKVLALGYVSPYFFFVLSGYILGVVYLPREKAIDARRFFTARFARIYPLYYVSVLLDVPFAVADRVGKYSLTVAMERVAVLLTGSTFMMQMWLPVEKTLNIPSWSLAIETVFYLSFPLLGPRLWKLRGKGLFITTVSLYVVGVFLDMFIYRAVGTIPPVYGLGSFMTVFLLGILLARWQALRPVQAADGGRTSLMGWALLGGITGCFVVVVYAYPWLKGIGLNPAYLLAPVYLALIWMLSRTEIYPVRLLNAKWLVVLGEASYGLYLLQLPILHLFRKLHLTGSPWNYPLYLATAIGLSVMSFYFFETPCRKWILRRLHTQTKETMEAASAAQ